MYRRTKWYTYLKTSKFVLEWCQTDCRKTKSSILRVKSNFTFYSETNSVKDLKLTTYNIVDSQLEEGK